MPQYDLDYHGLKIGFARTGKSTLCFQEYRRKHAFELGTRDLLLADTYMLAQDFVHNGLIYSKKQNVKKIIGNLPYGSDALFDEGYLTADRRTSMDVITVGITQALNFNADKNLTVNTCIQNLTDLDRRFFSKANSIDILVERGHSLCFCGNKNFPIVKDFYGFERFFESMNQLQGLETGIHNLQRLTSYVCEKFWDTMDGCSICSHAKHANRKCRVCECTAYMCENGLFAAYLGVKSAHQTNELVVLEPTQSNKKVNRDSTR